MVSSRPRRSSAASEAGGPPGRDPGGESAATETPSGLLVPGEPAGSPDGYVVPVLGARLPEGAVDTTFWLGLAGAAALGAIELPVAVALGAGMVIARHRRGTPDRGR